MLLTWLACCPGAPADPREAVRGAANRLRELAGPTVPELASAEPEAEAGGGGSKPSQAGAGTGVTEVAEAEAVSIRPSQASVPEPSRVTAPAKQQTGSACCSAPGVHL